MAPAHGATGGELAARPSVAARSRPSLGAVLGGAMAALRLPEDARRLTALMRRGLPARVRIPRAPPGPPAAELDAILRSDERGLDVALGAAVIALEDEPATDVEHVLDVVAEQAAALGRRLRRAPADPARRLEAFNAFFFDELGFTAAAARASRRGEDRLADLLLPHVLRRRRGHCLGLSSVYLALGSRVGLPLFGVSVPGHFFLRWDGEGLRRNIELTARGVAHPDAWYVERFRIKPALVDRGIHLQNLRRRELLVEILNNRANFYWDRGDVARASRDLDRVVQVSYSFARAHAGRGFLALQGGDLDGAREALGRALAIDPDYARAHLLLGQVHLRRGWLRDAEAAFEAAAGLDDASAPAVTYQGRLYQIRGEHDRAIKCHRRAIKLDPRCHTAWLHLGLARQALGELSEARAAYREASQLAPENLRAREQLVLLARGDREQVPWTARVGFQGVCRAYERRLRGPSGVEAAGAAYARFLLGAGLRLERALDVAREVAERAETAHNLELLARLLARAGAYAEAAERLARAIELDAARGGVEAARLRAFEGELRRGVGARAPGP